MKTNAQNAQNTQTIDQIKEAIKANMHKRCEVVPFNTAEWEPGYIAGIVVDKRTDCVKYAIKLDDGRRVEKVYNSKLLRISDEVQKVETRQRGAEPRTALTLDQIDALKREYAPNIGKRVDYINGEGRITSFMFDARVDKLFYVVKHADGTFCHKVVTSKDLVIFDIDDEGKAINEKFMARLDKVGASKEEKLAALKAKREKIEAQLKAIEEQIQALND